MTEFTPQDTTIEVKPYKDHTKSASMMKVMLWFGLGLLITGVIALTVPDLMLFAVDKFGWTANTVSTIYTVFLVISIILMIPSSLLVTFKSMRPRSGWMTAGYITYCVSMGFLLSNVFLTISAFTTALNVSFIRTVSVAFLATAGCFLLMGLFSMLFKKDLGILMPFLFTLITGAMILSLVNFFMQVDMIFWIVDFVLFGVLLLTAAIDIQRVRKIAAAGALDSSNNLAIYCAYTLYADFVVLFLRILYYVVIVFANNRNN
jgi:hypothetical protein